MVFTWQYVWINSVYNPGPALTSGKAAFSNGDTGWEAPTGPFSINLHGNQNNGSPGVGAAIPVVGPTDSITLTDPVSGAQVSGAVDAFADAGFSCFNTQLKPGYTSAGIIPANGAVLTVEWTNEPVVIVVPPVDTSGAPGCEAWPITWPCPIDTVDPELVDMAEALSAQLLWAMSGYRIGRCRHTEAFVLASEGGCGYPYKDANGNWRNGGRSRGSCCRVLLSNRPVARITEVVDGGVVLDPAEYRLEGSWLRRRGACWTTTLACEDPELIVTYQAGVPFPPGTPAVMGEVACEYLTALQGEQCRLPSRATSISRQGVTVTLDSINDFVGRRRLGLPITDAWLDAVATGPRVGSRVYSPDLARGVRQ